MILEKLTNLGWGIKNDEKVANNYQGEDEYV